MSRPVLVLNARLLDPASGLDCRGGLLAVGGRIAELGPQVTGALAPPGTELVDARGLYLIPGLVDLRAGFGEPGAEHKERFESGCLAAVAGGVTSLALLPDTDPPIDDPAMVEFVARRARQAKLAKVHPQAAVTRRLEGRELAELGLLKAAGAVAFTDGFRALADARMMRRALAYASMFDALIVQHPEEPSLAQGGVMNEGPVASRLGLAGIPAAAEVIMVERDLRLLELTGGRLHVAHVSTAAAVAAIRAAKARGLRVTCDTTPHHLLLTEAEVEGYRTFAKVSPPLRSEADREAVIAGLVDGTIDAIASDHCPQDQDSKRLPFAQAAFGVIGLQTLLAASLSLVFAGRIGLVELLRRLTVQPATILGLEAGRLARGAPADLVLLDLDASWTVTEKSLFSLAKNTPFEGRTFRGKVVRTFVDGRTVYSAEDPG
ncbi:MAG: dihydroorotase [Geminicoccaceae bacterium]|nr:MAG: dihydroorotase [Geminicoccaceae bacterium]